MQKTKGIADASKETGCSQRQLRNYETREYIKPPVRITCGEIRYRRYTRENIEEIKVFKSFIDQGFTLPIASAKTAAYLNMGEE